MVIHHSLGTIMNHVRLECWHDHGFQVFTIVVKLVAIIIAHLSVYYCSLLLDFTNHDCYVWIASVCVCFCVCGRCLKTVISFNQNNSLLLATPNMFSCDLLLFTLLLHSFSIQPGLMSHREVLSTSY